MKNFKIILLPIFVFILILILDFILTLESIRNFSESKLEYYFYKSREDLIFENIKESKNYPSKRSLFLLGTSHFGELSNSKMNKLRPDLLSYNYSSPSASFSYYAFILNKAIKTGLKPAYIVLEVYPFSATDTANYYALRYSYDLEFFIRYYKNFNFYDFDTFLRSRLFRTQIFPFKISEIVKKIKHPENKEIFQILKNEIYNNLLTKNGGIANNLIYTVSPDKLIENSDIYFNENFLNFELSDNQMFFLEEVLKICKNNNIKIIMVKPILYPYLDKKIKEVKNIKKWNQILNSYGSNYNIIFVNLQEYEDSMDCLNFIDSHHLSGGCYEKPTEVILKSLDK
jgi:hypothetical protein